LGKKKPKPKPKPGGPIATTNPPKGANQGVPKPGTRVFSPDFTITSLDDGTVFVANFGDGPAIVVDGYGGWQVVSRPKDIGLVEWQGRNPMSIEIPFLIDFWTYPDPDTSGGILCEQQVSHIERLCGIGSHSQPPICKVDATGTIPYDKTIAPGLDWVVESLSWDKAIEIRNSNTGRRLRCGGTVTIRQFVQETSVLRKIGPKSRAVKPKIYIVKKGDNLKKIAAKKSIYGDANKWKWIADANHIRDPRALYIGRRLIIPMYK
jgi:hypothetical protein